MGQYGVIWYQTVMGSGSDFDLTRGDSEEPRRGSVTQLRHRARPAAPPVIDEGDDWPTDNARSLAVPTPTPAATPGPVEVASRADAFNLEPKATSNGTVDPGRDAPEAQVKPIGSADHQPFASPQPGRTLVRHSTRPSAFSDRLLRSIRALLASTHVDKRAVIAACLTVALALGASQLYDALNTTGSRATSTKVTKASFARVTTSPTIDHSATKNSVIVADQEAHRRRATHRAHRQASHHLTTSTRRKHPRTPSSSSTTSSVSASQHTYTSPAPVATPVTPSSAQATSARTPPTSTSSSPKTPAFGANGALGPGSSPDG
jgi:hypothetical protein